MMKNESQFCFYSFTSGGLYSLRVSMTRKNGDFRQLHYKEFIVDANNHITLNGFNGSIYSDVRDDLSDLQGVAFSGQTPDKPFPGW